MMFWGERSLYRRKRFGSIPAARRASRQEPNRLSAALNSPRSRSFIVVKPRSWLALKQARMASSNAGRVQVRARTTCSGLMPAASSADFQDPKRANAAEASFAFRRRTAFRVDRATGPSLLSDGDYYRLPGPPGARVNVFETGGGTSHSPTAEDLCRRAHQLGIALLEVEAGHPGAVLTKGVDDSFPSPAAALAFEPVDQPSIPPLCRLMGLGAANLEALHVAPNRVTRFQAVPADEVGPRDRLEFTPAEPASDVADSLSVFATLQARHGAILGKGRAACQCFRERSPVVRVLILEP